MTHYVTTHYLQLCYCGIHTNNLTTDIQQRTSATSPTARAKPGEYYSFRDNEIHNGFVVVAYFFKNRLLWLGIGIAGAINLLNGLNALFPILPKIPLSYNLATHFIERPWNSIRGWPGMPVQANPFIIGLTFLIPLGLLLGITQVYIIIIIRSFVTYLLYEMWYRGYYNSIPYFLY